MTDGSRGKPPLRQLSVDDQWIVEWAWRGVEEAERHLARHAAFDSYLERSGRRDQPRPN